MTRPNYGIDAPGVVRNFFLLGAALALTGWFLPTFSVLGYPVTWLGSALFFWGLSWLVTSSLLVLYAKKGKFRHRDRLLGMVPWRGNETVLDVGTGRGLLMIGAAKRLPTGKSIGIDIWNAEDLSANNPENTRSNIRAEGVEGNTELRSEDVRRMSFPDGTFDVILSNLCVHNLYQKEQREEACQEIARVLKPGGMALISDFRHTKQYADTLASAGLKTEVLGPYWRTTFPKLSVVLARKELA